MFVDMFNQYLCHPVRRYIHNGTTLDGQLNQALRC